MQVRRASAIVVITMLLGLSGCGWLEDQFTADVAVSEDTRGRKVTLPGDFPTFDLLKDCMPAHRGPDGACTLVSVDGKLEALSTIRRISLMNDNTQAAIWRNRFQDYLLWRSEQQCERHKAGIMSTQSATNFSLNAVTSGVTAAAAVVTGLATRVLAAIGATTTATRSHFNEDFYRQFLAPAVVQKINEMRKNYLFEIMAKRGVPFTDRPVATPQELRGSTTAPPDPQAATNSPVPSPPQPTGAVTAGGRPVALTQSMPVYGMPRQIVAMQDYTLEESIVDVERYHQQCSFTAGLSALVKPNEKFEDTAAGVKQRLQLLRDQQTANEAQAKALGGGAAQRLRDTNADISRQIMILQNRLLTAPVSVDSQPRTGSGG